MDGVRRPCLVRRISAPSTFASVAIFVSIGGKVRGSAVATAHSALHGSSWLIGRSVGAILMTAG